MCDSGGCSRPGAPAPAVSQEIQDITGLLNKGECFVLNEDPRFPWSNLFVGDHRLQLRSDADEQLVLHLVFSETVKLHSIDFAAPEPASAPNTVKLYINRTSFSFDDGDSVQPTQVLDLSSGGKDHQTGNPTLLNFVKYQRVTSLTIFIEDNCGGSDYTALSGLKLYGVPVAGTDLSKIKKVG